MCEIVLDECLYYLREADNYLSLYHELDPYEEIFEAYKPDTQLKVEQNEKAKTGVTGSLTKACQAIMKMIQNIIDSIKDFFAKRNLNAEQRKAYEAFKAKCAKDPALKNKKISVQDFTKIHEEYNKLLAEASAADKALAQGKSMNLDNLFSKISNFCGDTVKGVTVAVGMEAALNIASSSQEIARSIYTSLKNDTALEKQLMEAVGKAETKKFEKQMKSLGQRASLHRLIMKMKGTYSKSVEEGIDKTFDTVWDVIGHVKNIAGTTGDLDPELAVKGNVLQRAANTVSYIGKNYKTLATDGGAALVKGGALAQRLMGNETINKTVNNTMHNKSQATKDARNAYKSNQKAIKAQQKEANRKKKIHEQSALDSLFAKNDPDAVSNKTFKRFRKD